MAAVRFADRNHRRSVTHVQLRRLEGWRAWPFARLADVFRDGLHDRRNCAPAALGAPSLVAPGPDTCWDRRPPPGSDDQPQGARERRHNRGSRFDVPRRNESGRQPDWSHVARAGRDDADADDSACDLQGNGNCSEAGIRAGDDCPGLLASAEQKRLNLDHRIPLHREGTTEQVADAILMMVKNDYITGETIVVDGGLTMRIA